MSTGRWRCFVAVPIGEALRSDLARAVDGWRHRHDLSGLRWMDPAGWHVTVMFLGDVDPSQVPAIVSTLQGSAAIHRRFRLSTGGVGGFPSMVRARVTWVGVNDAAGDLARLTDHVRGALGLDETAHNRPHITLARARRAPIDLRSWFAEASVPTHDLTVDRIDLFRSHLGSGSARYESLGSARLAVPANV